MITEISERKVPMANKATDNLKRRIKGTVLIFIVWLLAAPLGYGQVDTVKYFSKGGDIVSKEQADYYRVERITNHVTGKGYVREYYITGEKKLERIFVGNSLEEDANYIGWHKNGQIEQTYTLVKGRMQGKDESWYENGQLRWTYDYVAGYLQGDVKAYHANGQLKRYDIYKKGKLVEGRCYDETGKEVPHYLHQTLPEFPGGQKAMYKFILKEFLKEYKALPTPVKGMALVSFYINQQGKIVNIEVAKATHPSIGAIGIKVIQKMPIWSPATQDGEPATVKFTVPFRTEVN